MSLLFIIEFKKKKPIFSKTGFMKIFTFVRIVVFVIII